MANSRHVMLATPAHDHNIKVGTHLSILRARDQLNAAGHTVCSNTWNGDSLVPNARNVLLAKFHQMSECTDLIWIDHDVWWEGDEILRLMQHPVDFVAGSYRHKSDDESYPMGWLPDPDGKGLWAVDPVTGEPRDDGLMEVASVPGGFVRITRTVVEQMFAANPDRMYTCRQAPGLMCCCLYELPFVPNVGLVGEDYIFCERWRAIGGKVWLDPTLRLHHSGNKEYLGNLAAWLRNRDAPKGEDAEKELRRIRDVFSRPEMIRLFDAATGDIAA